MADELNAANWEERRRRLLDLGEPVILATLYFYSVLSWIWGLVIGVVAMAQCKVEANRRVGRTCLILAAVNFVLIGCLVAAYILLIIFALGWATYLASGPSGG
jgi:hypothetical protein